MMGAWVPFGLNESCSICLCALSWAAGPWILSCNSEYQNRGGSWGIEAVVHNGLYLKFPRDSQIHRGTAELTHRECL